MLCGYCFGEVERLVMSEYSGIEVCEDCYWLEVATEEAVEMAEIAGEDGLPNPVPVEPEPGLLG